MTCRERYCLIFFQAAGHMFCSDFHLCMLFCFSCTVGYGKCPWVALLLPMKDPRPFSYNHVCVADSISTAVNIPLMMKFGLLSTKYAISSSWIINLIHEKVIENAVPACMSIEGVKIELPNLSWGFLFVSASHYSGKSFGLPPQSIFAICMLCTMAASQQFFN